jgi:hypothetical protein
MGTRHQGYLFSQVRFTFPTITIPTMPLVPQRVRNPGPRPLNPAVIGALGPPGEETSKGDIDRPRLLTRISGEAKILTKQ